MNKLKSHLCTERILVHNKNSRPLYLIKLIITRAFFNTPLTELSNLSNADFVKVGSSYLNSSISFTLWKTLHLMSTIPGSEPFGTPKHFLLLNAISLVLRHSMVCSPVAGDMMHRCAYRWCVCVCMCVCHRTLATKEQSTQAMMTRDDSSHEIIWEHRVAVRSGLNIFRGALLALWYGINIFGPPLVWCSKMFSISPKNSSWTRPYGWRAERNSLLLTRSSLFEAVICQP